MCRSLALVSEVYAQSVASPLSPARTPRQSYTMSLVSDVSSTVGTATMSTSRASLANLRRSASQLTQGGVETQHVWRAYCCAESVYCRRRVSITRAGSLWCRGDHSRCIVVTFMITIATTTAVTRLGPVGTVTSVDAQPRQHNGVAQRARDGFDALRLQHSM